jgi:hypothetical protein
MVDWKKNNKVAIRNFTEGCDFHDLVKIMMVRILRRRHPASGSIPIYTEFNPRDTHDDYPDIWMQLRDDIYVFEIQEKVTKEWTAQIIEKHEDKNLIIIPLKEVRDRLNMAIKQGRDWVDELRHILEIYAV